MTKRKKHRTFSGQLLLIGAFLISGFLLDSSQNLLRAQDVLVESTAATIVVNTSAELANLKVADNQTVLVANVNGGSLLIYDADSTDNPNNNTIYEGPGGNGRFKAFSLSGISSGVPVVPAEPDDTNPAECTVVGTGVAATDTTNFETCLEVLNAAGGGVLYISGTVSLNANQTFTAPVSLIGVPGTDACIIQNDNVGSISWNDDSLVLVGGTSMTMTATAAFADHVQITTASNTLVAGDWFFAWSDNPVNGVTHNAADGNNPGELHQVKEIRESTGGSDYLVFDDFIVDALSNDQKIVECTMLNGITVQGLKFKWAGTTTPDLYSLRFRCCVNVMVENCHWVAPAPNEVQFQYCGNAFVTDCTFENTQAYDTSEGYHIVVIGCNGLTVSDVIAKGARHFFTTAGQTLTETDSFTMDHTTDTITSNSHGHLNGTLLRVSNSGGALPAGLVAGTDYFVVGATTNTFQLSSTLGGGADTITGNGTGTQTWTNIDRVGTPRNVLVHGVQAKCNGAVPGGTLVPFDTHAEGWKIVFDGCVASMPSEYQLPATTTTSNGNRGFQTRSRATIFKNCTVNGSGGLTPGFFVQADDACIMNCTVDNGWYGVRVRNETGGGTTDRANNCLVQGCHFNTMTGPAVSLETGSGHNFCHNEIVACASSTSSLLRAPINIGTTGTGLRVRFNSLDNQASNLSSIGGTECAVADITFVGNDMTGYTTDGAVFTASAGTEVCTSASHGLLNGQGVRLTTTGGLPGNLSADTTYYIINRTSSTFQLSTSVGGSPIDITTAGTGDHTWDMTTDSGIEWRNTDAANMQTEAALYNWTD